MGCYTLDFYNNVAILPVEAQSLLEIYRVPYVQLVESGTLRRSLDLCAGRPGVVLTHSFWDIISAKLFLELRMAVVVPDTLLLHVIDELLDDLALCLDHDYKESKTRSGFETARLRVFLQHIELLCGQDDAKLHLSNFIRLWDDLEGYISSVAPVRTQLEGFVA